jgi:ubiquinone/menaquinone biosynthesis C-methylase UbiE
MNDRRFDASKAGLLDDPGRLLWLPPAEVIDALAVTIGDSIADIGAGTGYFALPLAQAAGSVGQVVAVDAQTEMLAILRLKPDAGAVSNIELVHAEADSTGLPNASCNLVFMANVWHEFADRADVLRESQRILKTGGEIAILDWRPDVEHEAGPPLDHRLSASDAVDVLQSAGFAEVKKSNIGKYFWLVQGIMQGEIEQ